MITKKKFLNILILSWRGPGHPNAGGAETSTHEHAKGWVKAGHEVTLFTSYFLGAKGEELLDGVRIIRQGHQVFGVHIQALSWYLFKNKEKFDLVIDQFHGIPFFTPFYVRNKKLGFIHEVTKEVWKLNPWSWPFNLVPNLLGSIFEPLIFRFFYSGIPFMTVSESTKKDLTGWGIPRQNITVIHNGITIPKTTLWEKEKVKTITFLGALAKDKGIEDAIKVFAKMQKKYNQNFQYWVIGKADNKYLQLLKEEVKSLDLNNIKFWGYVSEDKKFELLRRSHVLINPSIREGWGLVVIEAAAMGTPSIAYNVAGLRDSIIDGKTGILSSENTIEDLALATIELLNNHKLYKKMCENAVFWSKNFSWEKASKQSLKLVSNLCYNDLFDIGLTSKKQL